MGDLLIFIILAVTIPRWSMTLQQVDTYAIAGLPIAAIGEAVVLELGNLFILAVFNRCHRQALKWRADWEVLDEANQKAVPPRTTRKPKEDGRVAGYRILPVLLLTLETLTTIAQTPFIAGQLLGVSAADLLKRLHELAVVGYAFILVIAPGVMTVAIGFARSYDHVMREIEKREPWTVRAREWLAGLLPVVAAGRPGLAARLAGHVDTGAASGRAVAGQEIGQGTGNRTGRANGRAANRTVAGQLSDGSDVEDVSQALAGHLAELRARLAEMRQQGARRNGTFRRKDVEQALKISPSHAKNVVRYGLGSGVIAEIERYEYEFIEK